MALGVPTDLTCAYAVPVRPGCWGDEVASKTGDDKVPRRSDGKTASGEQRNVGDALRAVYHDAVSESVPDEMLELLKKLG